MKRVKIVYYESILFQNLRTFTIKKRVVGKKTHPVEPIFVIDLLPKLDQKLLELLWSLDAEDWEKPTIAPLWCVKDIAAHLLDGNIRALCWQ